MGDRFQGIGAGRTLPPQRRQWLEAEAAEWAAAGLIDRDAAARILALYETEEGARARRWRLAIAALSALAALMVVVGIVLLIGYNWERIPRDAKVAIIFGAVTACFAAASAAHARRRELAGELLTLVSTLLFGAAIWLLAQVFHIQGHFPDAFFWWMLGTLATAALARSPLATVASATLLVTWIVMDGEFGAPNYEFVPIAAAAAWLSYRMRSPATLTLVVSAAAVWLVILLGRPLAPSVHAVAAGVGLLGCGAWSLGGRHQPADVQGRVLRVLGLGLVLAILALLTFDHLHRTAREEPTRWLVTAVTLAVLAAVPIAVAAMSIARDGARQTWVRDGRTLIAGAIAASLAAWAVVMLAGAGVEGTAAMRYGFAIAFSAILLGLAAWLVAHGVRTDSAASYFTGILAALVFVLVRWIDLIGDMLSSSMLFLLAGLTLFATARYWHGRLERGRASRDR